MLSVGRDELGRQFQSDFGDRFLGNGPKRRTKRKPGCQRNSTARCHAAMAKPNPQQPSPRWWNSAIRLPFCCSTNRAAFAWLIQIATCLPGSWMATSATAQWHNPEVLAVRILFVHCNYPAQFRHLSKHLAADQNNEIVFLCQNKEWTATFPNLRLARYQLGRDPKSDLCHPYFATLRNCCSSWTSSTS